MFTQYENNKQQQQEERNKKITTLNKTKGLTIIIHTDS